MENIRKEIKKMLNENILKNIENNHRSFNVLLDGNDYQFLALRTANNDLKEHEQLINGALGLCGESGEVADMVKKCFMQGHKLDVEHLAKELGDCMWYIALIADCIGYGLNGIMAMNVDKLKARYPDGFDADKSQNRKIGDV